MSNEEAEELLESIRLRDERGFDVNDAEVIAALYGGVTQEQQLTAYGTPGGPIRWEPSPKALDTDIEYRKAQEKFAQDIIRREIATAVLPAIISEDGYLPKQAAQEAVEYADALIAELAK